MVGDVFDSIVVDVGHTTVVDGHILYRLAVEAAAHVAPFCERLFEKYSSYLSYLERAIGW